MGAVHRDSALNKGVIELQREREREVVRLMKLHRRDKTAEILREKISTTTFCCFTDAQSSSIGLRSSQLFITLLAVCCASRDFAQNIACEFAHISYMILLQSIYPPECESCTGTTTKICFS